MRRIGSILITAVAIASCVSTTVEEDAHNGQGEVSIKLRQDHSVTAVKTSEDLPDINDFIVEIEEMSTDRLFFRKTFFHTVVDHFGVKVQTLQDIFVGQTGQSAH